MTALAMIIGMLPMSLGLGEGGEQNAPLGRAVIGGLLVATFFTLFFVPVMYSLLRRKPPAFDAIDDEDSAPVGTAVDREDRRAAHAVADSSDDLMLVGAGYGPAGDSRSDIEH